MTMTTNQTGATMFTMLNLNTVFTRMYQQDLQQQESKAVLAQAAVVRLLHVIYLFFVAW